MSKLVIPCEDGDLVLDIDYDRQPHLADLDRLDADLRLISAGKLDVKLPEEDTSNYTYTSPIGLMVQKILAEAENDI